MLKIQDTGNVYVAPELMKSIEVKKQSIWSNGCYNGEDCYYRVSLKDGTTVSYRRQKGTNLARIEEKSGTIIFSGLDDVNIIGTSGNDNYELRGCRGYVNTYEDRNYGQDQDQDTITTKHRNFENGIMQESCMLIINDRNGTINKTSKDIVWDT